MPSPRGTSNTDDERKKKEPQPHETSPPADSGPSLDFPSHYATQPDPLTEAEKGVNDTTRDFLASLPSKAAQGAAFGIGKASAEQFVRWLTEHLPDF